MGGTIADCSRPAVPTLLSINIALRSRGGGGFCGVGRCLVPHLSTSTVPITPCGKPFTAWAHGPWPDTRIPVGKVCSEAVRAAVTAAAAA